MLHRTTVFLGCLALSAAACGRPPPRSYGNALVGAALAVGAAGVNRAATGECWAACRPGTVCDKASGLCVEPSARASPGSGPRMSPAPIGAAELPPGHEYEVPRVDSSDCPCPPGESCAHDAGPVECAADASVLGT